MTIKITPETHDLFYELDAFDTHWQTVYDTIREAAFAAGCLPEYYDFLSTAQGKRYYQTMFGVRDTVAQNRAERKMREQAKSYYNRRNRTDVVDDDGEGMPSDDDVAEPY
jgi:hypothetical protein